MPNPTSTNGEATFHVRLIAQNKRGRLIRTSFGAPADNRQIVLDAESHLNAADWSGGFLLIDGPMSLPAAFVVAHQVVHRHTGVAVFDPKLDAFVVVANHGGPYPLGTLIQPSDPGLSLD